jgi:hypothetical protein
MAFVLVICSYDIKFPKLNLYDRWRDSSVSSIIRRRLTRQFLISFFLKIITILALFCLLWYIVNIIGDNIDNHSTVGISPSDIVLTIALSIVAVLDLIIIILLFSSGFRYWVLGPVSGRHGIYQKAAASLMAVVTALVAVFGVLRTVETNSTDAETDRLHNRFQVASQQLGDDSAAVRAAGVEALATVADDWLLRAGQSMDDGVRERYVMQAEASIGTIVTYLREDIKLATQPNGDDLSSSAGEDDYLQRFDPGELSVRRTISRVLNDHLKGVGCDQNAVPGKTNEDEGQWSFYRFDFTGAVFVDADFSGSVFCPFGVLEKDDVPNFSQAEFHAGVDFSDVKFSHNVSFDSAVFGYGTDDGDVIEPVKLVLYGAKFERDSSFRDIVVYGDIDFRDQEKVGSAIDNETWLSFVGASLDDLGEKEAESGIVETARIRGSLAQFSGKSEFNGAKVFGDMRLGEWGYGEGSNTYYRGVSFEEVDLSGMEIFGRSAWYGATAVLSTCSDMLVGTLKPSVCPVSLRMDDSQSCSTYIHEDDNGKSYCQTAMSQAAWGGSQAHVISQGDEYPHYASFSEAVDGNRQHCTSEGLYCFKAGTEGVEPITFSVEGTNIIWRMLQLREAEKSGDDLTTDVLIVSEYVLGSAAYSSDYGDGSGLWKDSEMRYRLSSPRDEAGRIHLGERELGDEDENNIGRYYISSFLDGLGFDGYRSSADEFIIVDQISNPDSEYSWSMEEDSDTIDQAFLISVNQAAHMDPSSSMGVSDFRVAREILDASEDSSAWWWLRSPGHYPGRASHVDTGGYVGVYGSVNVSSASGGVRPALWLNVESPTATPSPSET